MIGFLLISAIWRVLGLVFFLLSGALITLLWINHGIPFSVNLSIYNKPETYLDEKPERNLLLFPDWWKDISIAFHIFEVYHVCPEADGEPCYLF